MMQRKKKSAAKSQGPKPKRKAGATRLRKALSPKRRDKNPKSTVSPPSTQPEPTPLEPAPPRVDDAQLRRTDEKFRFSGYEVDVHGEAGRIVYPSGTPVRVLDPDSEPSLVEELLVKIDRSLRRVPNSDPIRQYDTVMKILLDWMKDLGPLRPADYQQVYTELNLRNLHDRAYNPDGKIPQITCCECGQVLGERQEKYCSSTCRQASKTKRQREKHPEYKARR